MASIIPTSKKRNAKFTEKDFLKGINLAVTKNGQVASCMRSISGAPSEEWIRQIVSKMDIDEINECFTNITSIFYKTLLDANILKPGKSINVAIDMHKIPRYDKTHGKELIRSKSQSGTTKFERYITIQCVMKKCRLTIGVLYMGALENTEDFVRKIVNLARKTGIPLGTVMADREFFSSYVMSTLDKMNVEYLIPCKNTPAVIDALNEYVQGRRGKISQCVITGVDLTVPYAMIITKRKKKESEAIEDRYIGFASNNPNVNITKYQYRWGIETGYRMVEDGRAKTHSKNVTARHLCFVQSICLFNVWFLVSSIIAVQMKQSLKNRMTLTELQLVLMQVFLNSNVAPEPPPKPSEILD